MRKAATVTQSADNLVVQRLKKKLTSGNRPSPKYGMLADYVLHNPDHVAFMTAAELGKNVGVSEATVIRFANYLAFPGYPEFQREFQNMVRNELTTVRRLRDSLDAGDITLLPSSVIEYEIRNLRATSERISTVELESVARGLLQAFVVYVVGLRASACLAQYLAYQAAQIVPRVIPITSGGSDSLELISPTEKGLMIAFAFPRYPRETVDIVEAGRSLGLRIVVITDSAKSPLAGRADTVLFAPSASPTFVDLLATPMALAAAIVYEASRLDEQRVLKGLARFEKFAKRADLFWKPGR